MSSRRNQVSDTQTRANRPAGVGGGAQTTPVEPNGAEQPAPTTRKRRQQGPATPKPAYVVVQVLDENGQPGQFDKRRIKVVAVERDANKVLSAIDADDSKTTFYLSVTVPPGTRAGTPNKA